MFKPEQIKILIVDDDDASRYSLARPLKRAGYQVVLATTGQEGLQEIEKRPDLVILDVQLPDMNGLEISRMLRQSPQTSTIPILQTSATFTMGSDKARGLDAGADGYLINPIEPEELLANVRMLLRLRFTQDALAKSNERLKSVIANIVDVFFAVDLELRFLEMNPAAEAFFGRSSRELEGKNLLTEFSYAANGMVVKNLQNAAHVRQSVHFEGESVIRPGTWWEGHIYPRDDRLDVYMRDITERKLSERQLFQTAEELKVHVSELQSMGTTLTEAKDKLSLQNEALEARVRERTMRLQETINDLETFSYSITHDMRAPLRAMQGFSKLLIEAYGEKLDAEALDYLQRIANASNRLDLLIRDVLSYGNVARTQLHLMPVNVDKLLHDIIREYPGFQPPQADIQLHSPLPAVLGNEAFLTQCFSNLLGNAVKFVKPNTVPRVEIFAERRDAMVRFRIKDNGIGIPPPYHHRLFKLFHRAQNHFPGTGVGLAIVRKAVERMGGDVGLESEVGQGSTFWVELKAA